MAWYNVWRPEIRQGLLGMACGIAALGVIVEAWVVFGFWTAAACIATGFLSLKSAKGYSAYFDSDLVPERHAHPRQIAP